MRGVRADVDPVTLVDADGRALWAPGPPAACASSSAATAPLARRGELADPGLALRAPRPHLAHRVRRGARARTRRVRAPTGQARPALRARRPERRGAARHPPHRRALPRRARAGAAALGGLAALGRRLQAVTLELGAGTAAVDAAPAPDADLRRTIRGVLAYADDDAAALAEATARDVIGAIARKKPEALAWLADATVERAVASGTSKSVRVTAPLPPASSGPCSTRAPPRSEASPARPVISTPARDPLTDEHRHATCQRPEPANSPRRCSPSARRHRNVATNACLPRKQVARATTEDLTENHVDPNHHHCPGLRRQNAGADRKRRRELRESFRSQPQSLASSAKKARSSRARSSPCSATTSSSTSAARAKASSP